MGFTVFNLAITILSGFEKSVENHLIDMNAHITVSGFGNRDLDFNLDDIKILENDYPAIESISPFISKNAILKSKSRSEGLIVEGILPDKDNSQIRKMIISGNYELGDSSFNLIIGEKFALKMGLNVNDEVILFSLKNNQLPDFDNPPVIEKFKIVGIYRSGMAEFDDQKAFANFNTLASLTGMQNNLSGFYIKLKDPGKINEITKELSKKLGYPYYVRSFYKTHQHIFTWLELQKKPVPIVLALIILVALFNIVGTLLMNILKQIRKIGVLKILGMTSNEINKIYLLQGAVISISGIALGWILTLSLTYLQTNFQLVTLPSEIYFISDVKIDYNFFIYTLSSIGTILIALLISLIPGKIAGRVSPLSIVRYN